MAPNTPVGNTSPDVPPRQIGHDELSVLPVAVVVVDRTGVIRYANPAVTTRLGYEPHDLVGSPVEALLPSAIREIHGSLPEPFAGAPDEAKAIHLGPITALRKDGTEAPVEFHVAPLGTPEPLYVATIIDASALEKAIRERDLALDSIMSLGDGVVVFSPDWQIVDVSPRFCELTGFTSDELKGAVPPYPWWPAGQHAVYSELLVETAREKELVICRKDGSTLPVVITRQTLAGGAGTLAMVRDASAYHSEVEHLQERAGLFGAVHDAVMITDLEDRILDWNPAATTLYGFDRAEVLGRISHEILETRAPLSPNDLKQTLLEQGHWEGELRNRSKDDQDLVVESRQTLILGETGAPRAILRLSVDITERTRASRQLEASEQRFRLLATQTSVGFFETDPFGRSLWGNERWQEITGARVGDPWTGNIHPDDQATLEAAWQAAFDVDRSFEDTVRIAKPDGSTLWVTVTAAPLHNELGSITGYMGTMTDISNVVLQHAEEEAERELAMVAVRDAPVEELLMVVTERVRELFGVAVCVIVRFDAEGMVTRVAASPDQPYLDHTFKLEKGMVAEVVLRTGRPVNSNLLTSGTDVVTKLNAFGLKISAGAPIYVGGRLWGAFIISDAMAGRVGPAAAARLTRFADRASAVIAHADARLLLEHLAATDSLTDLPNRRIFDETLRSEITRSTRYRRSLAVIVIDLDGFKNANDTAGHNAGDQLLQAVSSRMVRTARAAETIARIGGDEFGWILPEADETMASEAAARLLFAIGSESVGKIGTVTASAGVAIWAEGEEADELVRRADVAMYRAKAEGGNTFWVAEA